MKNHIEYPDFVARFYDAVYYHLRSGTDTTFFLEEIARAKGKVLEIGVGTGRFFVEALNNGSDVYGLDISRNMLEKLKEKIPPEHHKRLWLQDAVTMKLPHKFNLILAPFRVFAHLIAVDDQIKCLNNIWDHLKPGGRFIFDMYVPNLQVLHDGIDNKTDFEGEYEEGKRLKRVVSMKADLINQISRCRMDFIWDEQGKEHQASWEFDMRFFFRYEIEHLIRISKLNLETIYGDYERHALGPDSTDFVVVCSKRRSKGSR
jgi:SAM-dependent methyltransferase